MYTVGKQYLKRFVVEVENPRTSEKYKAAEKALHFALKPSPQKELLKTVNFAT